MANMRNKACIPIPKIITFPGTAGESVGKTVGVAVGESVGVAVGKTAGETVAKAVLEAVGEPVRKEVVNRLPLTVVFRTVLTLLGAVVVFGVLTVSSFSDAGGTVEYVPIPTETLLANPYVGFAPDARGEGCITPFSLVYMGLTWRELEPSPGVFDFETLERAYHFGRWTSEGKKFILRIMMDHPGSVPHTDIPDWLYAETGGAGTTYDGSLGMGFSPDYENAVLLEAHRRLVSALGDRYGGDSRVAFIELGSLGHWGEWHTMQEIDLFIPFPSISVSTAYIRHYLTSFPDKMLLMRRQFPLAQQEGMGLFNDMFGDEAATIGQYLSWITNGYTSGLNGDVMPAMPDFWKKAPSGGELANGAGGSVFLHDDSIQKTVELARATHLSWIGPNVPDMSDTVSLENAGKLLEAMGYRFSIRSEKHVMLGKRKRMLLGSLLLENKGSAPFYFPWEAMLALVDEQGHVVKNILLLRDIGTVMPGEITLPYRMDIPQDLAAGTYRTAFAVIDPETGKPGIQMPMKEKTGDGWYLLGEVVVVK